MPDTLDNVVSMLQATSVRVGEISRVSVDQGKILARLLQQHGYVSDSCRAALSCCDSGLQEDTDSGFTEGELPATVGLMMTGTRVERVSVTFRLFL